MTRITLPHRHDGGHIVQAPPAENVELQLVSSTPHATRRRGYVPRRVLVGFFSIERQNATQQKVA